MKAMQKREDMLHSASWKHRGTEAHFQNHTLTINNLSLVTRSYSVFVLFVSDVTAGLDYLEETAKSKT